jgi:hypothetical protein
MADHTTTSTTKIRFPVKCEYRGGNAALGKHGKHLWIRDGKIGHGEFRLTHVILLSQVHSVEVTDRVFGGTDVQIRAMPGLPLDRPVRGTAPKPVTDVVVRTLDGQEALWTIEKRSADWVRDRLRPALSEAGIPFYDDLLPDQRPTSS